MAVASEDVEKKMGPSASTDQSPSGRASDAASESPTGGRPSAADPSDRPSPDHSNSSPTQSRQPDFQPQLSLRSEEYRQLFRLPPDEALVQDFNCALQENFLLQGHMYLFVHYICFYSNLFGFETKKIIPFHEVTSVRRARAAAIFPTAIEIISGGKRYFFTSFLSRDEAFKIINEGWLEHGDGTKSITDQQESNSELNSQENGIVIVERARSFKQPADELDYTERNEDVSTSENSQLSAEIASTSSGVQDNVEEDVEGVLDTDCLSSGKTFLWEQEDSDAPNVPDYYMKVAESKLPIKVEECFNLFFSDHAVDFLESFHRKCGDKDFRCTSWNPHDKFGYTRDVSFQHPIKLYFGAKFGSCQEVQKFRLYRNSHLVIETSQEINDVPYGDYFRVEGLWDVERHCDESKECCILRVYINVAFSKKTMWKGKIVQSTVEECRDAYSTWIDLAHVLLKQKNLEKEGDCGANLIPNGQVHLEGRAEAEVYLDRSHEANDLRRSQTLPDPKDINQQVGNPLQGSLSGTASVTSSFRESMVKIFSSLKSQSQFPGLFIILGVILFLMQLSILVLLARPQQIHVISPHSDCMSSTLNAASERGVETMSLLEKRITHLKDEMLMVETLLQTMQQEYALLKLQLKDLELLTKQQRL